MSDLVIEIPAYGALAVAVGTFFWSEHRYREATKARRAVGPAPDIREAVSVAREDFAYAAAEGGASDRYFVRREHQRVGQWLRDLSDRPGDHDLRVHLLELAEAWDNLRDLTPQSKGRVVVLDDNPVGFDPQQTEAARLRSEQEKVARAALEICETTLSRLNDLELAT